MAVQRQPFKVRNAHLRQGTRSCLCLLTLALTVACRLSAATPPGQTNGPIVQFPSPVFDFGTALAGDPVEHVFEFTNAGNSLLEILGVYPGCSCTLPGEWTKRVAPGETGRVALLLDTGRFDGPVAESTVVASTDKAHFNVALRFKGMVRKPVELLPRTAILRPGAGATTGTIGVIRIINHLPEAMTLDKPVSDNPMFLGDLKTNVPGREYQLAVRTTSASHLSMTQGTISIKTSSARVPLVTVPVLLMPQAASDKIMETNSGTAKR